MHLSNNDSISLNKYISDTGKCSRREADKLIKNGEVTINGNTAKLGNRVNPGDVVKIGSDQLDPIKNRIYIAFNKPEGVISTTDLREPHNIISYVNHEQRLFPIGRLDKDSEGLIFLTNDGNIVNKILRSGNNHDKEYWVTVNRPITESFLNKMESGIPILGTITHKCEVEKINTKTFRMVLRQGLNRQIRRMCEHLDYKVIKLKRTRIMNVHLGKLRSGSWRILTKVEMNNINELIATSSKTEEASIQLGKTKSKKKYGEKRPSTYDPTKKTTRKPSTSKKTKSYKDYRKR